MTWHGDREVPEAWKKAIIVPLHKGKGKKDECYNYRGISLKSVSESPDGENDGNN